MPRTMRALIPSMFHRRAVLLVVAVAAGFAALTVRLVDLTVHEHEARLADARERLIEREWTPTARGRILDRKGRVLAQDRPAYGFAVDYRVLTGDWPAQNAPSIARALHRDEWPALDPEERARRTEEVRRRLADQIETMWYRVAEIAGTTREAIDAASARVIARIDRAQEAVSRARLDTMLREHAQAGLPITEAARRAIADRAAQPIRERRAKHAVLTGLPDNVGFELIRLTRIETVLGVPAGRDPVTVPLFPGAEVVDITDRSHPFDEVEVAVNRSTLPTPLRDGGPQTLTVRGAAWHVLGDLRPGAQADDMQRRQNMLAALPAEERAVVVTSTGVDRGEYRDTDAVGYRGVERAAEDTLRGLRGVAERNRATDAASTLPPRPGKDVTLTIDAVLQARIVAALDPALGLTRVQPWHGEPEDQLGKVRNGAAVILDIDTGAILAMVSTPSPTDLEEQADADRPEWQPDPYVNRAIAAAYPPGSIAKALILPEAVTQGRLTHGHGVVCTGHLFENRTDLFRCWIYKRYQTTHSPTGEPLKPAEAIKVSCNIFFYEMGRRLGVEGVARAYADFGLGEPFDLGIGPEWPGAVGSISEPGIHTAGLTLSDAILMGIGQGPISWTPLHAADAFATLARGGARIRPRLIADGSPPSVSTIELDQRAVSDAMAGLRAALEPGGTGHDIAFTLPGSDEAVREPIFNLPGIDLWGKTGTAAAPSVTYDPDGDGPDGGRVVRSGDHAWFVVLAGPAGDRPRYAAAVIIEYGGSGGRVAGPVMNQLLHALADEGYLPGGRPGLASTTGSRR